MNNDYNKKIVFVGGIHGVGKTTLCKKISNELALEHYSSSELISKLKAKNISKDKKVNDISGNQNILLQSVNKYLSEEKLYLLDGHFCLLDSYGCVTKIPFDTFKHLCLEAIIVLVDDESKISERLMGRDTRLYPISLVKQFQTDEIQYAKEVAEYLNIKYKIINVSTDFNEALLFIKNIMR